MSEVKIITEFIFPPIPIRDKDWRAWVDGDEESHRYGEGATEWDAVLDFIDTYADIYWPGGLK